MKTLACWLAAAIVILVAGQAQAQTGDDVIEKHLAAIGGRAALAKLESRIARGTMTISVQGVELSGPIEMYAKAPNKQRTFARFDLSAMGAGEMVVDQRFDGKAGYRSNTMQGDRDLTDSELQSMQNNAAFPTPLLNYKQAGGKAELAGKDKIGDRAVYLVLLTPKAGVPTMHYFDAETYQLLRVVTKVQVPEMGGDLEQTIDFSDYRDVDGVKVPFTESIMSTVQAMTIRMSTIEHNKPIDETMFSKPAAK